MERIELYDKTNKEVMSKTQEEWITKARDFESVYGVDAIEVNNAGEAIELLCDQYDFSEQLPDSKNVVSITVTPECMITYLDNGDRLESYNDGTKVFKPAMVGNSVITQEIVITDNEYQALLKSE